MKEETSHNFNLSGDISFGKTHITAMSQYSIIDNQVRSEWLNQDTIQYVNRGNTKIFSSEITLTHRFSNSLQAKASYAYVHDSHGKSSTIRPHTATFRLNYTADFIPKCTPVISFSGKYFSGRDIYGTGDVTDTDNTTGIDKTETKEYKIYYNGYLIWRLTLNAPLLYGFTFNAGVNNLFDYKPEFSSFYSSISSGRTFYIGLKWKFN